MSKSPRFALLFLFIIAFLFLSSCQLGPAGWRQLHPITSPPALLASSVAYDPVSMRAILFGGTTNEVWSDETWQWDGNTWAKLSPANHPEGREKHAMTYDSARRRIVLFGGSNQDTVFNDTWEFDGSNWYQLHPVHSPLSRCCLAMAYDSISQRVVLYGGWDSQQNLFFDDVWEWDGEDWTQRIDQFVPLMAGHLIVEMPSHGMLISIQTGSGGTLAWKDQRWFDLGVTSPPSRSDGRAAYDNDHEKIVYFGGSRDDTLLNDLWVFDGAAWREANLVTSPSPRFGHIMFYDIKRHSIILFGGYDSTGRVGNTWELELPIIYELLMPTPSLVP